LGSTDHQRACGLARRHHIGLSWNRAFDGCDPLNLVGFCLTPGLDIFDVVGFSLGGMIAQQLAFEFGGMVNRMILLGTGPRGGEGMTFTELSIDELSDPEKLLMNAFFTPSDASQAAGRAYLERLKLRVSDRDEPVSTKAAIAQLGSIREWGTIPLENRFAMLARFVSQRSSCTAART
jgi:pimeloyl-ACP methyl ester carboxylesterase